MNLGLENVFNLIILNRQWNTTLSFVLVKNFLNHHRKLFFIIFVIFWRIKDHKDLLELPFYQKSFCEPTDSALKKVLRDDIVESYCDETKEKRYMSSD